LTAAVPAPYTEVLCVNVNKSEVHDLIFENFVSDKDIENGTYLNGDPKMNYHDKFAELKDISKVKTPIDGVFDWNSTNTPPSEYAFNVFCSEC
jgi:hypothetical protein